MDLLGDTTRPAPQIQTLPLVSRRLLSLSVVQGRWQSFASATLVQPVTRAQAARAAVSETGGHLPRGAHGAETVATTRERAAAGLRRTVTQPPRAVPQAEARPPVSRQLGLTCGKDLEAAPAPAIRQESKGAAGDCRPVSEPAK